MPATREKKKEVIAKLKDVFSSRGSVVFVHYNGVQVADEQGMRRELKDKAISYTVAKKTLARRALADQKITGELPKLAGEIAFAWSENLTDAAREVYNFQKKFGQRVLIVGGIFDGAFKNQEEMTEIAKIPSLEILRAQFVNLINSPLQGLAIALNALAEKKETKA